MSRPIELTHCTLHLDRNVVECADGETHLTATESDLLSYLVAQAGRTISKEELLRNVWRYAPGVESRAPDHTVNRLRTKIEADPKNPDHLTTVYGVGYRLDLPEAARVSEPEVSRLTVPPLSAPPKPLRGRQDALAEIERWLSDGTQWLTIVGPGGMGKTHLARAAAAGRPAVWCDLRAVSTEAEVIASIGEALGLTTSAKLDDDAARVVQALGALSPELVVLDNLEQIDAAALSRVHEWLDELPQGRFLTTSRQPTRLPRETVLRLDALTAQAARDLFEERAQAITGSSSAWASDVLDGLMAQLGGLPLAIELAAGRMGILGPEELCGRLAQDVGILSGGHEHHHQTLWHTLERSWDLLDPQEREVLSQCTIFERPFELGAVQAVVRTSGESHDVLGVLSRLVDASMLQRVERSGPCFDFYALTRQFVESQGAPDPDVALRHMTYFQDLCAQVATQQRSSSATQTEQRLRSVVPDLMKAITLADSADPHAMIAMVSTVRSMLGREIPTDKASQMADSCVAHAEALGCQEALSLALSARARVHFVCGRWDPSYDDLDKAIGLAIDTGHLARAAGLENQLGAQLLPRGEVMRAQAAYGRGLQHAEAAQDAWQEGRSRTGLARVNLYTNDTDAALAQLRAALPIVRAVGDREGECRTLGFLGRLASRQGHMAQAELHFRDAIECYRDDVLPGRFSWIMASRTEIYLRWGRIEFAERCATDALAIAKVRGMPAERPVADFNLGMLMLETGSLNRAEAQLRSAKRAAEQLGVVHFVGHIIMGLSWLYFEREEYMQAKAAWKEAESIHASTGNPMFRTRLAGLRGLCALCEGQLAEGISGLVSVLAEEGLDSRSRMSYQLALGVGYIASGKPESATEVLSQACQLDPDQQVDLAATQALARVIRQWLQQGCTPDGLVDVQAQVALCRQPAGPDLAPATMCSIELRWLIRMIEQYVR